MSPLRRKRETIKSVWKKWGLKSLKKKVDQNLEKQGEDRREDINLAQISSS